MAAMGRHRQSNTTLPPRMHLKNGVYFHVSSYRDRKWTKLGTDLAKARILWAQIENGGISTTGYFNDYLDQYLVSPKFLSLSKGTQIQYESVSNAIRVCFDKVRIGDITPPHIAGWLDNHPSKIRANTGRAVLTNVFKAAVRAGVINSNPCTDIASHNVDGRERYITDGEYRAIWEKAEPHVQIAMDIGYLTGSRIQAILDIKLSDITPEGVYIFKDKTKGPTRKRVLFIISPALEEVLNRAKRLPRTVRGMHLLCNQSGRAYPYHTFNRHWGEAVEASGIQDIHFHDIRAKAATDAKELGMDHQKLLGHASKAMSDKYVKIRQIERVETLPNLQNCR